VAEEGAIRQEDTSKLLLEQICDHAPRRSTCSTSGRDVAAFACGQPAPDPVLEPVHQGVLEAFDAHGAARAHTLRGFDGRTIRRKECCGAQRPTECARRPRELIGSPLEGQSSGRHLMRGVLPSTPRGEARPGRGSGSLAPGWPRPRSEHRGDARSGLVPRPNCRVPTLSPAARGTDRCPTGSSAISSQLLRRCIDAVRTHERRILRRHRRQGILAVYYPK
jgi:hypothetical protein